MSASVSTKSLLANKGISAAAAAAAAGFGTILTFSRCRSGIQQVYRIVHNSVALDSGRIQQQFGCCSNKSTVNYGRSAGCT